jgi:hypothetical protein
MPRKISSGSQELFKRTDKSVESHTTLQISINTITVKRNYYFASAELGFLGITWQPMIRKGSQIRSSLTRSADAATIEITNADTNIGNEFLLIGHSLYNAEAQYGRLWKDKNSGLEDHKVLLKGPIVGLFIDENVVRLTAVSEPYAQVSVGARRRVTNLCQWFFRQPDTCGYTGSLLTCNFMLNHADGCQGRHGDPLKRARHGGMVYLNSKSRLKTI